MSTNSTNVYADLPGHQEELHGLARRILSLGPTGGLTLEIPNLGSQSQHPDLFSSNLPPVNFQFHLAISESSPISGSWIPRPSRKSSMRQNRNQLDRKILPEKPLTIARSVM